MSKRFTDTELWKNQRWFRKLSPINKLVFCYIKDQCNHAGLWKIDCSDLIEDLGIDGFDLDNFLSEINAEFDKISGKKVQKNRVKNVKNNYLWITGFIQFQYEGKDKLVNFTSPVRSAFLVLKSLNLLEEGLDRGYITLKEKLDRGWETPKDKDRDKDKENKYSNYKFVGSFQNSKGGFGGKNKNPKTHEPAVAFSEDKKFAIFEDGSKQELGHFQKKYLKPELVKRGIVC